MQITECGFDSLNAPTFLIFFYSFCIFSTVKFTTFIWFKVTQINLQPLSTKQLQTDFLFFLKKEWHFLAH